MFLAQLCTGHTATAGHVFKHGITLRAQVFRLRAYLINSTTHTGTWLMYHDSGIFIRLAHVTALQYIPGHALRCTHYRGHRLHAAIPQCVTNSQAIIAIAAHAVNAHVQLSTACGLGLVYLVRDFQRVIIPADKPGNIQHCHLAGHAQLGSKCFLLRIFLSHNRICLVKN